MYHCMYVYTQVYCIFAEAQREAAEAALWAWRLVRITIHTYNINK